MSERYERSSFLPIVLCAALGSTVFNIGVAIGKAESNADGRVHDVQVAYSQVYDQLDHTRQVEKLILKDQDHTFTFDTEDQQGTPEICSGKYEEHNNLATLVGDLSCTQVVPLPQHS